MTTAPSHRRAFVDRLSAVRARVPRSSIGRLALIVVIAMTIDVTASAAVWVDRLNEKLVPDFRHASLAGIDWTIDTYADSPPILDFTPILPPSVRRDGRGKLHSRGGPVDPDVALRYVMGALAQYDKDQDRQWVRNAGIVLDQTVARSRSGLLAHGVGVIDALGRTVDPPWYSASTQGLMLSALARMHEITGQARWREPADEVFARLYAFRGFFSSDRPAPVYWLTSVDPSGYLWFDRYSTGDATVGILNEQLTTIFGIYDYRRALAGSGQRRKAETLLAGSFATLEHFLPRYRVAGRLSFTSLAAGNVGIRDHQVAATQLRMLGRTSGSPEFSRFSRLFDSDDNVPYFNLRRFDVERGVDAYNPLPASLARLADRTRPLRVTAAGLPTAGRGTNDPTSDAAFALAAIERFRSSSDRKWLVRAETAVIAATSAARDGFLTYDYDKLNAFGEPLHRPWHSAEGQGLLLSALTRLYDETGEARWLKLADETYQALTVVRDYGYPSPQPWLAFLDFSGYLWFEQYPDAPRPSRLLRGHLDALIGIYDYGGMTNDPAARFYFDGGLKSVRDALPRFIRTPGGFATSSLGSGAKDPSDHVYITDQIAALAQITGDGVLSGYARFLAEDFDKARTAQRCAEDDTCRRLSTQ